MPILAIVRPTTAGTQQASTGPASGCLVLNGNRLFGDFRITELLSSYAVSAVRVNSHSSSVGDGLIKFRVCGGVGR